MYKCSEMWKTVDILSTYYLVLPLPLHVFTFYVYLCLKTTFVMVNCLLCPWPFTFHLAKYDMESIPVFLCIFKLSLLNTFSESAPEYTIDIQWDRSLDWHRTFFSLLQKKILDFFYIKLQKSLYFTFSYIKVGFW